MTFERAKRNFGAFACEIEVCIAQCGFCFPKAKKRAPFGVKRAQGALNGTGDPAYIVG